MAGMPRANLKSCARRLNLAFTATYPVNRWPIVLKKPPRKTSSFQSKKRIKKRVHKIWVKVP